MLATTALRNVVSNATATIAFDVDFSLDVRVLTTLLAIATGRVSLLDSRQHWRRAEPISAHVSRAVLARLRLAQAIRCAVRSSSSRWRSH
jgi:hypothetical protein